MVVDFDFDAAAQNRRPPDADLSGSEWFYDDSLEVGMDDQLSGELLSFGFGVPEKPIELTEAEIRKVVSPANSVRPACTRHSVTLGHMLVTVKYTPRTPQDCSALCFSLLLTARSLT